MSTKATEAEERDAVLLEKAQAVRKEELSPLRFDPMVAKQVCTAGLAFLNQHLATLRKQHPGFDLKALQALPDLCVLASLAQHAAEQTRASVGAPELELVMAGLAWRKKLMPLAKAFAVNGRVDAEEVERIRGGRRGNVADLRDVIDLVKVLAPHEELVSAACGAPLAQAGIDAEAGLRALGLKDDAKSRAAADLRDRYATLIYAGYDRLRVAVATVSSYNDARTIVRSLRAPNKRKDKALSPEPVPVEPVM